jgi:dTDP-4-dehydrorhamnose reductase
MKLLIIGKTGQLGSSLIIGAKSFGYDVISLDRHELDITTVNDNNEFRDLLEKNKPDYVINTAADNNVIENNSVPLYAFNTNCVGVKNMAEICDKLNIPFITFSTDYVFDGKKGSLYEETDIPSPVNIYGISKLAGEYASLIYDNTTVIRTCGLYGLYSKSTKNGRGNFVDNRIADAKKDKQDNIEISYEQIVSPTYTDDLSKAVIQLIDHPIKKYNLYHLVNEGYCSWYDFTKEIYEIMNIDCKVVPVDRKGFFGSVRKPLFSALRNMRAKELGITLPHWRDGLRRYLETKYSIELRN